MVSYLFIGKRPVDGLTQITWQAHLYVIRDVTVTDTITSSFTVAAVGGLVDRKSPTQAPI